MRTSRPPCWIETIKSGDASPDLKEMYRKLGTSYSKFHNLYHAFSLQPKPLLSADRHFRDILHNETNHIDAWLLELLATQVAIIADCHYAFVNHGANFKRLLGDDELGERMLQAVRNDDFAESPLFTPKQAALLTYGAKLSRAPEQMKFDDIASLHDAGVSDTEILEAVQATACFAYWVRFINALGINLESETIDHID